MFAAASDSPARNFAIRLYRVNGITTGINVDVLHARTRLDGRPVLRRIGLADLSKLCNGCALTCLALIVLALQTAQQSVTSSRRSADVLWRQARRSWQLTQHLTCPNSVTAHTKPSPIAILPARRGVVSGLVPRLISGSEGANTPM